MARNSKQMHPGRVLREEYMEPLRLDTAGLAEAVESSSPECKARL